jgi:hypothetical protein
VHQQLTVAHFWLLSCALLVGCHGGVAVSEGCGPSVQVESTALAAAAETAETAAVIPHNPLLDRVPVPGSYEALLHALCRGEFDDVLAATEGGVTNYKVALLRLRALGGAFAQWYAGSIDSGVPREELARESRRRVADCSRAYETAFQLAPSRFERARVTAAWLAGLRFTLDHGGDSELLRSGLPSQLPPLDEVDEKRMAEAGRLIGDTVRRTFNALKFDSPAVMERHRSLGQVFEDQFVVISRINPPDDVIKEVVENLPVFLVAALPEAARSNPEEAADSVLWYLWVGFTQPLPHPVERAYIDRDIEEYARRVQEVIDSLSEGYALPALGARYADRFRRSYLLLGDNRLVPYFKRACLPHQRARVAKRCEDIPEFVRKLRSGHALSPIRQTEGASAEHMEALHRANASHVWFSLLRAYLSDAPSPARLRQLPEREVVTCGMGLNDLGMWAYSISSSRPIPPFSPENAVIAHGP